jgi:hypothetical protein
VRSKAGNHEEEADGENDRRALWGVDPLRGEISEELIRRFDGRIQVGTRLSPMS